MQVALRWCLGFALALTQGWILLRLPRATRESGIMNKLAPSTLKSTWRFPVRLWLMWSRWLCLFPCICWKLFNWSQSSSSWCSASGQQNKYLVVHLIWSGTSPHNIPVEDALEECFTPLDTLEAVDSRKTLFLHDLLWNMLIPEMDLRKKREKKHVSKPWCLLRRDLLVKVCV